MDSSRRWHCRPTPVGRPLPAPRSCWGCACLSQSGWARRGGGTGEPVAIVSTSRGSSRRLVLIASGLGDRGLFEVSAQRPPQYFFTAVAVSHSRLNAKPVGASRNSFSPRGCWPRRDSRRRPGDCAASSNYPDDPLEALAKIGSVVAHWPDNSRDPVLGRRIWRRALPGVRLRGSASTRLVRIDGHDGYARCRRAGWANCLGY